jgi:hypothetical protein
LTVGDTIGGIYLVYMQPVSRRHLEKKSRQQNKNTSLRAGAFGLSLQLLGVSKTWFGRLGF